MLQSQWHNHQFCLLAVLSQTIHLKLLKPLGLLSFNSLSYNHSTPLENQLSSIGLFQMLVLGLGSGKIFPLSHRDHHFWMLSYLLAPIVFYKISRWIQTWTRLVLMAVRVFQFLMKNTNFSRKTSIKSLLNLHHRCRFQSDISLWVRL